MVSNIDTAKRTLVRLIKCIAAMYSVVILLTRESTDVEVRAAFKKVARKAHPDKGGTPEHQKALNAARDTWENALGASRGRGYGCGPRVRGGVHGGGQRRHGEGRQLLSYYSHKTS